jgi:hypothetical protein
MRQLRQIGKQLSQAPDGQISLTDPDARSMATSGRGTGMVDGRSARKSLFLLTKYNARNRRTGVKGSSRNAFDQAALPPHGQSGHQEASKNPGSRDLRLLQLKFCVFTRPRSRRVGGRQNSGSVRQRQSPANRDRSIAFSQSPPEADRDAGRPGEPGAVQFLRNRAPAIVRCACNSPCSWALDRLAWRSCGS